MCWNMVSLHAHKRFFFLFVFFLFCCLIVYGLHNSVPCKRQLEWISYQKTWSGNQNVCQFPYFLSISSTVVLHVAHCFYMLLGFFSHCNAECSLNIFKPEGVKGFSLEFLELKAASQQTQQINLGLDSWLTWFASCIVVMRIPFNEGLLLILCIGHCEGQIFSLPSCSTTEC